MHYPPPPPPPPHGRRVATGIGVSTVVAIVFFSLLGPVLRGCNRKMATDKKELAATLPAVGSEGTLAKAGATARLCPAEKFTFGWPCSDGRASRVDPASRVRVMKTGVHQMEALCRYWVQGGPQTGASGDAPCEWFVAL